MHFSKLTWSLGLSLLLNCRALDVAFEQEMCIAMPTQITSRWPFWMCQLFSWWESSLFHVFNMEQYSFQIAYSFKPGFCSLERCDREKQEFIFPNWPVLANASFLLWPKIICHWQRPQCTCAEDDGWFQVLGALFSVDDLTGFEITKFIELPAPFGIITVWGLVLPSIFVLASSITNLVLKDGLILQVCTSIVHDFTVPWSCKFARGTTNFNCRPHRPMYKQDISNLGFANWKTGWKNAAHWSKTSGKCSWRTKFWSDSEIGYGFDECKGF